MNRRHHRPRLRLERALRMKRPGRLLREIERRSSEYSYFRSESHRGKAQQERDESGFAKFLEEERARYQAEQDVIIGAYCLKKALLQH